MSATNLYSTPGAIVDDRSGEIYQPQFLAASGRIGRLRYLAYSMSINVLLLLVMLPIAGGMRAMHAAGGENANAGVGIMAILGIGYLIMFVMSVIYGKRRLNDLDKSGWLVLLSLVPLVNALFAIYVIFFPGTRGPNRFGPPPAPNPLGVKLMGLLFPAIFVIGILAAIAIPAYHDYTQRAQQAAEQLP